MAIRWDPLLVRGLAAELDTTLRGARLRAIRLDAGSRDLALLFRDRTLVWRLHPDHGIPFSGEAGEARDGDAPLRARVRSVHAPEDERLLVLELAPERSGRGPWQIVIELMGHQLNAIVTEGEARTIRHLLRRREGSRPALVGATWEPPPTTGRRGVRGDLALDTWMEMLEPVPPPDRARTLTREIAWTSPINASALLADLAHGHALWQRMVLGPPVVDACVLETERGPQPYPFTLEGHSARPAGSLLDAFARCATRESSQGAAATLALGPRLLARLDDGIAAAERRLVRLQAELDGREDPAALRTAGDLLLARYGDVPQGADSVALIDFDGTRREIPLDPSLPPHRNADRYYDRAQRSERAGARLPALIRRAEEDRDALLGLRERAHRGEVDAETVAHALPDRPTRGRGEEPSLPYRRYRSSGGLEIRVGRGAKHNDDLTFRNAAPDDVWMHARHVPGAHVILRWPHDGAPPARDLHEAAVLAALHSKARTSGSVPVDWTLRKYVRKPRGAAPGSVVPERVSTVFVTPDERLLDRLADD